MKITIRCNEHDRELMGDPCLFQRETGEYEVDLSDMHCPATLHDACSSEWDVKSV